MHRSQLDADHSLNARPCGCQRIPVSSPLYRPLSTLDLKSEDDFKRGVITQA